MTTLLTTALLLGLGGSLHCLGMCGPLVAVTQGRVESRKRMLRTMLPYHGGRILVYAGMGLIAGQIGYVLNYAGLQSWLSIGAGVLLILICLTEWIRPDLIKRVTGPFQKIVSGGTGSRFRGWMVAGMLNGLLPCGLVLAALAIALQPGSWYQGAAAMVVFGLGTVPMLIAAAVGAQACQRPALRRMARVVFPLLMLGTGIWLIMRGLPSEEPCCPHEAEVAEVR